MSSLSRELVFLILQFLDEEKFKESMHRLEKESGFYFNIRYFEECVTNGEWDDVEKYLSGFTKVDDNRYSMKIFFEIRKQKYLEALDKNDNAKAVEILKKDLKVFSTFNEDLFKEITLLLTLPNFRENEQLSKYGDTKSARAMMLIELKKLIEANPLFRDKLQFPSFKNSRLRTLINQSCGQPNGTSTPSPSPAPAALSNSIPKVGGFPPIGAHGPFQPAPASFTASLGGWMTNPTQMPHPAISGGPIGLAPSHSSASMQTMLKRPRTPPTSNPGLDFQHVDPEHVSKRSRPFGIPEEANNLPINLLSLPYAGQSRGHNMFSSDDLPKAVVANLNQGSAVKSIDFHPSQQSLLLVGTNIGDVSVWEIGTRERLAFRNFKVWDLSACSVSLQASLANEYTASVNRVTWSPDGTLFGVAYTKHIVHIYTYNGGDDVQNHLEIDAHTGYVSDLAFSRPNKQLCIITCGEDKTIKVFDAATGAKQYSFEGHNAPVYSVCPHFKENIEFVFSTAVDGKIKAWLYDNMGPRVDFDAPGHSCMTMAYSADGTRLFSCGTSKDGESFIVEWNENEGSIKRTYFGLGKRSVGVVQFDTTKNRILAAGDEFQIKFWDMDNTNLMATVDAEGGLPASPCIRFNKEGTLLAVSTSENSVKILANGEGVRLARSIEGRKLDTSRISSVTVSVSKAPMITANGGPSSAAGTSIRDSAPITMNGDGRNIPDVKSRIPDDLDKSKIWKLMEINEPSQLRSLKLPDGLLSVRILKLVYTNSGGAVLALAYNAVHKLWKWQRNDRNTTGKATATVPPQLWQPSNGILMTNDISESNLEEAVPCFALSKNDSYVMSASGGKISLFNMMTFKTMTTFMAPPPVATSLAFHPQDNNVLAIGMEDSSIQIYNVRVDEVKSKLKGHHKKVTGLAFSNVLNVLVSSGADAQLCVWSTDVWEKKASKFLPIPSGREPNPSSQTRVQFHNDQIHMLVVHETQLAIYEASKLECIKQWVPLESSGPITDATYSCDSQLIYASFGDGTICVLTASALRLRCRIYSTSYMPSNPSTRVHPLAIAAHPQDPNQFALGLTDGGVLVMEPLESEETWGTAPPKENGQSSNVAAASASGPDQS